MSTHEIAEALAEAFDALDRRAGALEAQAQELATDIRVIRALVLKEDSHERS